MDIKKYLTLDGFVALLQLTIFNSSVNGMFLWLAYSRPNDLGWAKPLLYVSYASLFCQFGHWASGRWRNGDFSAQRLKKATWKKQVVVVTGGAAGMGKEIVEQLAKKGAWVAALDITQGSSEKENIKHYKCDISDRKALEATAARIRTDLGHPTMLVNNAGVNNNKLILDLTDKDLNRMIDVNLRSQFYTIQTFLPNMIEQGKGHIVATSSAMGYVGVAQMTDYVATKHAVIGLMESLRYELDKKYLKPNIRTSLVIIGHVKTALFADFKHTPLASFLAPSLEAEDVAKRIVDALETQESTYIAMPFYANLLPVLKILPSWARDGIQWASGADSAMPGITKSSAVSKKSS